MPSWPSAPAMSVGTNHTLFASPSAIAGQQLLALEGQHRVVDARGLDGLHHHRDRLGLALARSSADSLSASRAGSSPACRPRR
jgi:hypothetical protein